MKSLMQQDANGVKEFHVKSHYLQLQNHCSSFTNCDNVNASKMIKICTKIKTLGSRKGS